MAMNTGGDDNMMSEINVTPLVDVMLVLLTVFIVTAPLLMNSVPVNLPKASSDLTLTQPESINISVTADGTMYFSDETVNAEQLDMALMEAAQNVDTSVEIFADEKAEYDTVDKVMAELPREGLSNLSFSITPDWVQ